MDDLPEDPFTEAETDAAALGEDPLPEDTALLIEVEHRMEHDNGRRTSYEDVLAAFEMTLDDCADELDDIDRLNMIADLPKHDPEDPPGLSA